MFSKKEKDNDLPYGDLEENYRLLRHWKEGDEARIKQLSLLLVEALRAAQPKMYTDVYCTNCKSFKKNKYDTTSPLCLTFLNLVPGGPIEPDTKVSASYMNHDNRCPFYRDKEDGN